MSRMSNDCRLDGECIEMGYNQKQMAQQNGFGFFIKKYNRNNSSALDRCAGMTDNGCAKTFGKNDVTFLSCTFHRDETVF